MTRRPRCADWPAPPLRPPPPIFSGPWRWERSGGRAEWPTGRPLWGAVGPSPGAGSLFPSDSQAAAPHLLNVWVWPAESLVHTGLPQPAGPRHGPRPLPCSCLTVWPAPGTATRAFQSPQGHRQPWGRCGSPCLGEAPSSAFGLSSTCTCTSLACSWGLSNNDNDLAFACDSAKESCWSLGTRRRASPGTGDEEGTARGPPKCGFQGR